MTSAELGNVATLAGTTRRGPLASLEMMLAWDSCERGLYFSANRPTVREPSFSLIDA